MATTKARTRMGRKRQPAPPRQSGDPWHLRLARLIDKKKKGRTDAEIADAAGITPTYLSRMLKGDAPDASVRTVMAILATLDASLCDLDRS